MDNSSQATDNIIPGDKWEFNDEVTDVFDDMLKRSIPQHDIMRQAVFYIGSKYIRQHTDIVDMGCSRGEALLPFVQKFGAHNRYKGIEISEPMLKACRERFAGYINTGIVDIVKMNLKHEFPMVNASLVMSVLTLQFTPIEYRQQIVGRVIDSLTHDGAFVLVEKVIGSSPMTDELFNGGYMQNKQENGYTKEQIERKRLSLEGVLVPVTARWNEEILHNAGFRFVECFWRWMNFAGWIAVK